MAVLPLSLALAFSADSLTIPFLMLFILLAAGLAGAIAAEVSERRERRLMHYRRVRRALECDYSQAWRD